MKLTKEEEVLIEDRRREIALKNYKERYGEHHPVCTCPECLKLRRNEPKLKTLWRIFMFGTKAKAPKVIVPQTDRYICPGCKEETLYYDEREGVFICSNEKCKDKFALIQVQ